MSRKDFDGAQASCTTLGAGWHAPLSNKGDATPHAADNSNSLEAVGKYFARTTLTWFWSSSTVSNTTYSAWNVDLAIGYTPTNRRTNSINVVCVRP